MNAPGPTGLQPGRFWPQTNTDRHRFRLSDGKLIDWSGKGGTSATWLIINSLAPQHDPLLRGNMFRVSVRSRHAGDKGLRDYPKMNCLFSRTSPSRIIMDRFYPILFKASIPPSAYEALLTIRSNNSWIGILCTNPNAGDR